MILENEKIKQALEYIKEEDPVTTQDTLNMCQIPAPSYKEEKKAEYIRERFREIGLRDVRIDAVGNVLGIWPGTGEGPSVMLAAHTDTVFPEGTDLTIRKEGNRYYCPGINDDTHAVAEMIAVAKAMIHADLHTKGDLIFCANVCEEGLGDLRGVKYLFGYDNKASEECPEVDAFVSIDNQYTGDDLYTVIKGLCEENNIGFKIILTDDNKFEFCLYAGADRSYDQTENPYVVFSPNFENIINSNYYSSKANLKNVTLVAGEGEGASRKTTVVGSGSGLDRRELFTDARDISSDTEDGQLPENEYIAQLTAKGEKNLADHDRVTAFEGEVEVTRLFKYGEDFFIGDIVQIANEYGNEGSAYISELIISRSKDEQSIYPTFKTISEKEGTS